MRGCGCTLIILGTGGLLLPVFGFQFKLVRAAVESIGLSPTLVSIILLVVGFVLLFIPNLANLRSSAITQSTQLDEGLASVGPSVEEIISLRYDSLSEDAIRKIYPFYGEMMRRGIQERYDAIARDIAPRAGVTEDDVVLFNHTAFKAMASREKKQ